MTRDYAATDRDELARYASELEYLVVDLYAMVAVELETRGFWGFLGRSFERCGIAQRMVDLGFTGRCEDDSAAFPKPPCQKPAKDEIFGPDGFGGLSGSQAGFTFVDELRPRG